MSTLLRLQEDGLSENQLSYEIGHAHGYINNITGGHSLPSMKTFLAICERFAITPANFFDSQQHSPALLHSIYENMKMLDPDDLQALAHIVETMKRQKV